MISDEELAKELRKALYAELAAYHNSWDNLGACVKDAYRVQARRAKELLGASEPPKDLLRAAREAFCENARLTSNWDPDDGPISRSHLDSDIVAVLRVAREYHEKRPLDKQIRLKREEIALMREMISQWDHVIQFGYVGDTAIPRRILAVLQSQFDEMLVGWKEQS